MGDDARWRAELAQARAALESGDADEALGWIQAAWDLGKELEHSGALGEAATVLRVVHEVAVEGVQAGVLSPALITDVTGSLVGVLRGVRAWAPADAAWREAIALVPEEDAVLRFEAHLGYGWFLHERRDPEALTQLALAGEALARAPQLLAGLSAMFHVVRSHAYLVNGNPQRALNATHQAVEFLPDEEGDPFLMILDVRVGALLRLGRFDEARGELTRAQRLLAAIPDHAEFRREGLQAQLGRHEARLLLREGRQAEALAAAAQAAEVFERHMGRGIWLGELELVEALVARALAEISLGAEENAVVSFAEAIERAEQAIGVGRLSQPELAETLAAAAFALDDDESQARLAAARQALCQPQLRELELVELARDQARRRPECAETQASLACLEELGLALE
jgi:tetratricopeptide (TPR) repeat protein